MASTGFSPHPQWTWPKETFAAPPPPEPVQTSSIPGTFHEDPDLYSAKTGPTPRQAPKSRKHWPPRQCRICLDTVLPTVRPPTENVPNILQPPPSVTYESADPELGRLLRPCKCKGSSKYVHEGCLQAWRHADPGYARRNYWQCPTCGFQYRLERMRWSKWITSTSTQLLLTTAVMLLAIFLAGFIGDVVINFYLDPYWFISTRPWAEFGAKFEPIVLDDESPSSWAEHFLKGFASVGLLGFAKVLFTSPWHWWNLRGSGGVRRTGGTGRDRMAGINWLVVVIGVSTFLWAVYKGIRAWTRRTLEKAGERVMDATSGDDEEEEEGDGEAADSSPPASSGGPTSS